MFLHQIEHDGEIHEFTSSVPALNCVTVQFIPAPLREGVSIIAHGSETSRAGKLKMSCRLYNRKGHQGGQCMSWHFSQALEAEFLAENCSDGEQFAPWNSLPFALDDSRSAKMKETCHRSPFGTMFVPSTDALGAELLTWFQAAFRAKTFPAPERAPESKEVAPVCGPKWRALSVKLAPNGSWLKIRPSSHQEGSEQSCETWPKWGSMRNGECWERLTPERPTSGKESGLLPTIRATDGERGGRGDLIQAVRGNENSHFRLWSTPQARDFRTGQASRWKNPARTKNLNDQVASAIGGQLNPDWVEWLMGWPIGWTACEPLETDRFQQWPQWHSGSSPDAY